MVILNNLAIMNWSRIYFCTQDA